MSDAQPARTCACGCAARTGRWCSTSATRAIAIGRAEDNDVVVKGNLISRLHARIEINRNKFVLIDQSTNGTFVQIAGRRGVLRAPRQHADQGRGDDRPGQAARAGLAADDPLRLRRRLRRPGGRASAEALLRVVQLREHAARQRGRRTCPGTSRISADFLAPQRRIHRQQLLAAPPALMSSPSVFRSCGARQLADRRCPSRRPCRRSARASRPAPAGSRRSPATGTCRCASRRNQFTWKIAAACLSFAPTFSQCCQ